MAAAAAANRRSLGPISARLAFYLSLAHERTGALVAVRPALLALHRTAALRRDEASEEMLINLLLRNYLHYSQYEAAEAMRARAPWPDKHSNSQYCRHLYYLGRIRAVQLEYGAAKECLAQAARKAPRAAAGFRLELTKWLVLVRLLLGEVPERPLLQQPGLAAALAPYYALTRAVRAGDLAAFAAVAERHAPTFARDRTANLIVRLRRNGARASACGFCRCTDACAHAACL